MKRLLFTLITILLFASPILGAITEKYCIPGGAGAKNGTSWANAWDLFDGGGDDAADQSAAGTRLNIRGSFSGYGSDITFATDAGAATPLIIRGCTTTEGDGGYATIDMAAFTLTFNGDFMFVEGLDVTTSDTSQSLSISGDGACIYRCKVQNTAGSAGSNYAIKVTDAQIVGCYASTLGTAATTYAIYVIRGAINNCFVQSPEHGIFVTTVGGRSASVNGCIIKGTGQTSARHGIVLDDINAVLQVVMLTSNTIYNFDDGFHFNEMPDVADSSMILVLNNLVDTLLGYGVETDDTEDTGVHIIGNAAYNTAGATASFHNLGDQSDIGFIQCTTPPLRNPANGDFSLTSSGSGALLRAGAVSNNLKSWPFDQLRNSSKDVGAFQTTPPKPRRRARYIGR